MDPDAVWAIVTDETADLDTRGEAAMNLLAWLAKGGGLPNYTTAVSIATMHAYVVDQCTTVLSKVLDHLRTEDERCDDRVDRALDDAAAGDDL